MARAAVEHGLRVPRGLRPLAAPARRAAAAAVAGDRRAQRGAGAVPDPEGDRGEHPRERRARRRRRRPRAARLGDRLGAHELRQGPDRARAARDGEPARRLHRPSDEPPDRRAQPVRRSTSSAWSRARSRPARSSRSTRSPTGSTSATRTRGSPARPGVTLVTRATRTRPRRSATSSSASPRPGAPG